MKKDLGRRCYFYISRVCCSEVKQVFLPRCIICVVYNVPRRRKLLPPFLILYCLVQAAAVFSLV